MAKVCTMFSGSSGNCTYISCGNEGLLVDTGVSSKQILLALEENLIDPAKVKAIFITHSHTDHIKGLRVLLKRLKVPVFASKETLGALLLHNTFCPEDRYFDIENSPDIPLNMGVEFFRTSHDCAGSGGYAFNLNDGQKVSVCTDLGVVTDSIREKICGSKAVVFESNHDVGMLQNGPYPFETKQRILSDVGHLSNVASAVELADFVKNGATNIILAHLSKDNNTPDIARVTAQSLLMEKGLAENSDYSLYIAPPKGGKMFYI